MVTPFSILITGPESSGKTTLAKDLSDSLNGSFISEYAREYLNELNHSYELEDLNKIIDIQHKKDQKAKQDKNSEYLFFDTGPIVLSVWLKVRFNKTSSLLNEWISNSNYDLILLCKPDIPWVADPLREHPEQRVELHQHYKRILNENNLDYHEVKGDRKQRLAFSLEQIDSLKKV